jgi:hypothetical protein
LQKESGLGGAPHLVGRGRYVGWSLLCGDQPRCAEKLRAAALCSAAKEKSLTVRDSLFLQPKKKAKKKKKKKKRRGFRKHPWRGGMAVFYRDMDNVVRLLTYEKLIIINYYYYYFILF